MSKPMKENDNLFVADVKTAYDEELKIRRNRISRLFSVFSASSFSSSLMIS